MGGKPENQEKNPWSKVRTTNKLNPHKRHQAGMEPRPHWWGVSTLTTPCSPYGAQMVKLNTNVCIHVVSSGFRVEILKGSYKIQARIQGRWNGWIFTPPFFWFPFFLKVLVFRPFQFQEKEKTKSGYKHNKKVSHGIFSSWRFVCYNIHPQKWRLQNMTRFEKTKTKAR